MRLKSGLILLVLACALAGVASAQTFPTRQITLLVGFPPGGGTDGPSRVIADKMRASLGVPVVVENRPGGQQMVAIRAVQASPPDGYTLLVGTGSSLAQNPALNPAIGYDPLRDFTLIGQFGVSQGVIVVHSSVPAQTLQELVEYLRKNPGQSYATGGVGAAAHLSMSLLTSKLGLEMVHVPYKGDGPAMVDLASGRVPVGMMSYISARGAGDKVRILAATSVQRLPYAPEVPSLSESGLPELVVLDPYTFFGIVGPPGLPPEIVARLNRAVQDAVASPDVAAAFGKLYTVPVSGSAQDFRAYVEQQLGKWKPYAGKFQLAPN